MICVCVSPPIILCQIALYRYSWTIFRKEFLFLFSFLVSFEFSKYSQSWARGARERETETETETETDRDRERGENGNTVDFFIFFYFLFLKVSWYKTCLPVVSRKGQGLDCGWTSWARGVLLICEQATCADIYILNFYISYTHTHTHTH